jgi:hypothetical protein
VTDPVTLQQKKIIFYNFLAAASENPFTILAQLLSTFVINLIQTNRKMPKIHLKGA